MHVGVCDSATSHSRMKSANVFEVVFSLPLAVSGNTSVKVLRTALKKGIVQCLQRHNVKVPTPTKDIKASPEPDGSRACRCGTGRSRAR